MIRLPPRLTRTYTLLPCTALCRSVVAMGNDRHLCGLLAIADTVRPGAADTLRALRATGIEHLVMLTGDNQATAEAIARAVGIDEVHAELLPADQVAAIEYPVAQYGTLAMVGDGDRKRCVVGSGEIVGDVTGGGG